MRTKITEGKSTLFICGAIIAFFVILSIFFNDPTTNTIEEANNSMLTKTLENAETIELHKVYFHPNTKFNIYVNNNKVGTITRNNKIFTGKTFKLRDLNGNVIRYETEKKRFFSFNISATFFNFENKKTLYIKEDKIKNIANLDLNYRYSVFNFENELIGYTKAKFPSFIKRKHYINNLENETICNIEKSSFSLSSTL